MTQNTGNLRVRRMKKLLREALLELIEERGFDALTVSEIIQRAMVSRTAFYRNYQDKYDLVEQIFEDEMHILTSALGNFGPERQRNYHATQKKNHHKKMKRTVKTLTQYPAWKALVNALGVIGKQVHDARLVAVCHVHAVTHLLTFNVAHGA